MDPCSFAAIFLLTNVSAGAWPVSDAGKPLLNCEYEWTAWDERCIQGIRPLLDHHFWPGLDAREEYMTFGSCTCEEPLVYFLHTISSAAAYWGKRTCMTRDWSPVRCPDIRRQHWIRRESSVPSFVPLNKLSSRRHLVPRPGMPVWLGDWPP